MKKNYSMVQKSTVGLLLLLVALVSQAAAQGRPNRAPGPRPSQSLFQEELQFGLRLGGWSHQGIEPRSAIDDPNFRIRTDYASTNAYLEALYVQRLSKSFGIEISAATLSRGEVNLTYLTGNDAGVSTVGSLALYPIYVRGLFYPIPGGIGHFRPAVSAGLGFTVGTHSIQFADSYLFNQPETEIALSWTVGAAMEYAVATAVVIEVASSFQSIQFDQLLFESDFDGLTITVGGKYLLGSRTKS